MFLTELFDRATDWKLDSSGTRATFSIDKLQYIVDFIKDHEINKIELGGPREVFKDLWEVNFMLFSDEHAWGTDHVTGTGNAIVVFSTVFEIAKTVMKEKNIQNLVFTSDASEPSRAKLYNRMATGFAKEGWRYIDDKEIRARSRSSNEGDGFGVMFLLTKQPHPHSLLKGTKHD